VIISRSSRLDNTIYNPIEKRKREKNSLFNILEILVGRISPRQLAQPQFPTTLSHHNTVRTGIIELHARALESPLLVRTGTLSFFLS